MNLDLERSELLVKILGFVGQLEQRSIAFGFNNEVAFRSQQQKQHLALNSEVVLGPRYKYGLPVSVLGFVRLT